MVDKAKKIWIDGQFIDWDAATVHILTHSLHYGLAVFDGMRAYKRADGATYVFRLREHVDRLFDSCKMCFLKPEDRREHVSRAGVEVLRVNDMPGGYLRPMAKTRQAKIGISPRKTPIRTAVMAWKWGAYL